MTALDVPDIGPAYIGWVYVGILAAFLIALLWGGYR